MLREYARKRRFDVTPEPSGEAAAEQAGDVRPLTFVMQKHAATRLHYDLRFELNGVLVSWAVPKGPSLDPSERRLAVHVEDHPFDYGGFEGNIPQGQYGGGEVIVWDRGNYYTEKAPRSRELQERELNLQLERGKIEVVLEGEKLKGGFVLIHTRDKQWLLMKRQDEFASDRDVMVDDRSVLSDRRIGGVATPRKKLPEMRPMLLSERSEPFSGDDWSFELKLDGVRVLTYLESGQVRMVTRNGNDATSKLPRLCKELEPLADRQVVLDGEIVVFDEQGRPNFQLLMEGFQGGRADNAFLCLFDLLFLDGTDLRSKPWHERRKALEELAPSGPHIRVLDTFPRDGELLYDQATKLGFEGVVGKRVDSRYEDGRRSQSWVKLKQYRSEEFVIGGYTRGNGGRAGTFGALLVGEHAEHGLQYVASVGGGFEDSQLDGLKSQLDGLRQKDPPFTDPPKLKGAVWVKPELVAEVRYMNRTNDGSLRFPSFLHLRPDLQGASQVESIAVSSNEETMPKKEDEMDLVLSALSGSERELRVTIDSAHLHLTNLDKEIWPGVTKRDLIVYYGSTAETLLLYLRDRPVSIVRCPNGVDGESFFQKHWDRGRPEFAEAVTIHSDTNSGARDYMLCNNRATLLWFGQIAAVELNPWNSRVVSGPDAPPSDTDFATSRESLEGSVLNHPDYLVLDLDPHFGGKGTGWKRPEWERLVEVALELKAVLATIGLRCFPKSSGKSGLHLYVPIQPEYTYDQIRSAGFVIGEQVAARLGKKVTLEFNVRKRPDGVFIDINQNVRGKTMAAAYSPRAAAGAGVSMPLLWTELPRIDPTQFTVCTAADRLREKGDLWRELLQTRQRLVV
jgi:bifunctional non-homologous end joining protein LigD